MVQPPQNLQQFSSLIEIVTALRGPDGCPWDKEQTHRSLTPFAIEEAHELAEAVEQGSTPDIVSELGDVLLQVVLHAEIGRQEGRFNIEDVIRSISEKMVRRHPHVFADTLVENSNQVLNNWNEIKAAEKKVKGAVQLKRFDVPLSLPALARAHKIGDKTNRSGFDWPNATSVLEKVDEEVNELKEAMQAENQHAIEHELGDVLFSVGQLARHLGLEGEQCLRTTNARFERRYFNMLDEVKTSGREWDRLTLDEKEIAWQKSKASLQHEENQE